MSAGRIRTCDPRSLCIGRGYALMGLLTPRVGFVRNLRNVLADCLAHVTQYGFYVLLAGCATAPDRPKLLTEVQTLPRMESPIPTPCKVDIPKRPLTAMPPPDSDVARLADGAKVDVCELNNHIDALEAALLKCGAKPYEGQFQPRSAWCEPKP